MKIIYFWKPTLWLAIICYALFIPASSLPVKPFLKIPHIDKIVHFTLFFVFCLFLLKPLKKINIKYYFWAPAFSLILGAMLEFIQHALSHSRSTDIFDFFANTTGIVFAPLFFWLFISNRKWEVVF